MSECRREHKSRRHNHIWSTFNKSKFGNHLPQKGYSFNQFNLLFLDGVIS